MRFVKEAGVDMIKLDGAAEYPEAVTELTRKVALPGGSAARVSSLEPASRKRLRTWPKT